MKKRNALLAASLFLEAFTVCACAGNILEPASASDHRGSPFQIAGAGVLPAGTYPDWKATVSIAPFDEPDIVECSGITSSHKLKNVMWVHNDSGDTGRVWAVNTRARVLGEYKFTTDAVKDCEDIAFGPGPDPDKDYVYVGDIGDNSKNRAAIYIYRFAEPAINENQVRTDKVLSGVEKITFKYGDGNAHNCETMFVDPVSGDLFLVIKDWWFAGDKHHQSDVYLARAASLKNGATVTLQKVTSICTKVDSAYMVPATGADISKDGHWIVVRNQDEGFLWYRSTGVSVEDTFKANNVAPGRVPVTALGEAITFAGDGSGVYHKPESGKTPLYYVPSTAPLFSELYYSKATTNTVTYPRFIVCGYLFGNGAKQADGSWKFHGKKSSVDHFKNAAEDVPGIVIMSQTANSDGSHSIQVSNIAFQIPLDAMPPLMQGQDDDHVRTFLAAVIEGEGDKTTGLVADNGEAGYVNAVKSLLTQLGIGSTLSDNNGFLSLFANRSDWDVAGGKASENLFWYMPFVSWDRTPGGAPPAQ